MSKFGKTSEYRQRIIPRARKYSLNDEAWIEDFLTHAPFAAIAVNDGSEPYINTNIFFFAADKQCIYFHSAIGGRLRDAISENPKTCLSISEMGRFIPDRKPLKFSVEYCGVAVFGQTTVMIDDDAKARALQQIMGKYAPHLEVGRDYDPVTIGELNATTLFCMEIDAISGKGKRRRSDYPGAYEYRMDRSPLLDLEPLP